MILDPCLPALHHTAATLRAWTVWGRAHPWWHAPVRAVSGPCSRAAALALPLLAGPAAGPLLAAPVVPELPWIGAPGWVQTALPFGPGGYAPGFGGGYGYAGGAGFGSVGAPALVPGGLPAVGAAYEVPATLGVPLPAILASSGGAGPMGSLPTPAEGGASPPTGGRPMPASDTPTDVPEPAALAVFAVGVLATVVRRSWHGA